MVRLGLLDRKSDPIDRRIKRLVLTSAGHSLAEKFVDTRREWMEQFTTSLTTTQRETITDALKVLTDAARSMKD